MAKRVQHDDIDMGTHRVVNVRLPDSDTDAATKGYVDFTAATTNAEVAQAQQDAAIAIIEAAEAAATADNASAGAAQAIEAAANAETIAEDASIAAAQAIIDSAEATATAQDANDVAAQAAINATNAEVLADNASISAAEAIELANGKAEVTSGASPPADPRIDDVWIDTESNSKVFVWGGEDWLHVSANIPPNSVTNLEISDFALTVKKFNTSNHMIY